MSRCMCVCLVNVILNGAVFVFSSLPLAHTDSWIKCIRGWICTLFQLCCNTTGVVEKSISHTHTHVHLKPHFVWIKLRLVLSGFRFPPLSVDPYSVLYKTHRGRRRRRWFRCEPNNAAEAQQRQWTTHTDSSNHRFIIAVITWVNE